MVDIVDLAVVRRASKDAAAARSRATSARPQGLTPLGEIDVDSLNDLASVSRPVFRKLRLKAVLEETNHELEEVDLGPLQLPRKLNSHTSIALSPPFFPRTCRLRC